MAVQAPRCRASKAAAITDMPLSVLARFLERRIITLDPGDLNIGGSGRPRMFGTRTLYRIALVHRLTRAGLPPAAARTLADRFCDTGQSGRQPGSLFPTGRTLLIASQGGTGKISTREPPTSKSRI
jgi:hypothetical protein